MKHIPMRLILLFVASLTASSAYADDCGESDRVTLPTCATSGRIQGTKPGMWVQNSCSHPITVKFAKSGGDTRRDIATGVRIEEEMKDGSALCCPRYNSCEDIALGLPPNLARGKTATQSSLQNDAVPGRAVDGISDGNYNNRSVTHTLSTAQAWWQVDLGSVQDIRQVVLFNRTDCCAERLSNFEIKVSSDGATWTKVAELAGTAPQRSAYPMNATGRYVRVQLRGTNNLSLAEVQVFGPQNLALGRPATQSSLQNDAVPGRAVDGNPDGNYNNGSVTHTLSTAQAWWQVDLGSVQGIRQVVLFNRTDCCAERLSNFEIKVSSDGATWTKVAELAGAAPQRSAYPMNAPGATYACSCAAPTT